ncbi:hypothetical protein ACRW1W_26015, partial [Escherichia coli]
QKQKKLIMLPSETMIWQPEFTDKTLSRKTGAVQPAMARLSEYMPHMKAHMKPHKQPHIMNKKVLTRI